MVFNRCQKNTDEITGDIKIQDIFPYRQFSKSLRYGFPLHWDHCKGGTEQGINLSRLLQAEIVSRDGHVIYKSAVKTYPESDLSDSVNL